MRVQRLELSALNANSNVEVVCLVGHKKISKKMRRIQRGQQQRTAVPFAHRRRRPNSGISAIRRPQRQEPAVAPCSSLDCINCAGAERVIIVAEQWRLVARTRTRSTSNA